MVAVKIVLIKINSRAAINPLKNREEVYEVLVRKEEEAFCLSENINWI